MAKKDDAYWYARLDASYAANFSQKIQDQAIAYFRRKKRPAKILFNGGAYKPSWENILKCLQKWLPERDIVERFVDAMADPNWPGAGYAYESLAKGGKDIIPVLKKVLKEESADPDSLEDITYIIDDIKAMYSTSTDPKYWINHLGSGAFDVRKKATSWLLKNFPKVKKKYKPTHRGWYVFWYAIETNLRAATYHKDKKWETQLKKLLTLLKAVNPQSNSMDPDDWMSFILPGAPLVLRKRAQQWWLDNVDTVKMSNGEWWTLLNSLSSDYDKPEDEDFNKKCEKLIHQSIARLHKKNKADDWLYFAAMVNAPDMQLVANNWILNNFKNLKWKKSDEKWFELFKVIRHQLESLKHPLFVPQIRKDIAKISRKLLKLTLAKEPFPNTTSEDTWYGWSIPSLNHWFQVKRATEWWLKRAPKIKTATYPSFVGALHSHMDDIITLSKKRKDKEWTKKAEKLKTSLEKLLAKAEALRKKSATPK
jgi:hypothetical protein